MSRRESLILGGVQLNNSHLTEKRPQREYFVFIPFFSISFGMNCSEGSAIWFTKQLVVARACRFTIGHMVCPEYDSTDREHRRRQDRTYVDVEWVMFLAILQLSILRRVIIVVV
jgi:hypothetical protein